MGVAGHLVSGREPHCSIGPRRSFHALPSGMDGRTAAVASGTRSLQGQRDGNSVLPRALQASGSVGMYLGVVFRFRSRWEFDESWKVGVEHVGISYTQQGLQLQLTQNLGV